MKKTVAVLAMLLIVLLTASEALALNVSVPAIRAKPSSTYPNTVWDKLGINGSGVIVAVMDTGVDDGVHQSLPSSKFVAGYNAITSTTGNPDDDNGHGSHCAGIAIGTGGSAGKYKGVAPGAKLVDVKVLDSEGSGSSTDIVKAMNWCKSYNSGKTLENKIRVVSASYGGFLQSVIGSDGTEGDCMAANSMVDSGIVVVAAAGNGAGGVGLIAGPNSVSNPSSALKVISVGAIDDQGTTSRGDDSITDWSSKGPNGAERKPNVAAPGVDISSVNYNTATGYTAMSGTSMSCPHVSGLCALIICANINLTALEVKQILQETAQDMGTAGWDSSYGFGYVDAYGAVKRALDLKSAEVNAPSSANVESPVTITAGVNYTKTEYSMYLGTWTSGTTSSPKDRQSYEIVEINITIPAGWTVTADQITVNPNAPSGLTGTVETKQISGNIIQTRIKYTWAPQPSSLKNCTPTVTINTDAPSSQGNYEWKVSSYNINKVPGKNAPSKTVNVQSGSAAVPAKVTGLTATAGNQQVSLSWTAPNPGSSPITTYYIYWGTSTGDLPNKIDTSSTATSYTHTGRTNGQIYYYQVSAVNSEGEGEKSDEKSATPATVPAKVEGLTPTAGNQQVSLSWTAPNNGGSAITGYKVYWGTSSPPTTVISTGTGTTYSHTGRTNGQIYYYQVAAVNAKGEGEKSDEKNATPHTTTTPAKITGLTAAGGNAQVSLSWNANPVDDEVTKYYVYRGTGGSKTKIAEPTTTSCTDTGLTNGNTYYYQVSAVNVKGEGTKSDEKSATPSASQTWYLDDGNFPTTTLNDYNMSKTNPNNGGNVKLTDVTSTVYFVADEPATTNVSFGPGNWSVNLYMHMNLAYSSVVTITVGSYNVTAGLGTFTPFLSATSQTKTVSSTDAHDPLLYAFTIPTSGAENISQGDYLALQITGVGQNTVYYLTIHMSDNGQTTSTFASPSSDPGYPVPELSTLVLMTSGLLLGVGMVAAQKKKKGKGKK